MEQWRISTSKQTCDSISESPLVSCFSFPQPTLHTSTLVILLELRIPLPKHLLNQVQKP